MQIMKGRSAKLLVDGRWVDLGTTESTATFLAPCRPHRWVVRKGRRARCATCGDHAPR